MFGTLAWLLNLGFAGSAVASVSDPDRTKEIAAMTRTLIPTALTRSQTIPAIDRTKEVDNALGI